MTIRHSSSFYYKPIAISFYSKDGYPNFLPISMELLGKYSLGTFLAAYNTPIKPSQFKMTSLGFVDPIAFRENLIRVEHFFSKIYQSEKPDINDSKSYLCNFFHMINYFYLFIYDKNLSQKIRFHFNYILEEDFFFDNLDEIKLLFSQFPIGHLFIRQIIKNEKLSIESKIIMINEIIRSLNSNFPKEFLSSMMDDLKVAQKMFTQNNNFVFQYFDLLYMIKFKILQFFPNNAAFNFKYYDDLYIFFNIVLSSRINDFNVKNSFFQLYAYEIFLLAIKPEINFDQIKEICEKIKNLYQDINISDDLVVSLINILFSKIKIDEKNIDAFILFLSKTDIFFTEAFNKYLINEYIPNITLDLKQKLLKQSNDILQNYTINLGLDDDQVMQDIPEIDVNSLDLF